MDSLPAETLEQILKIAAPQIWPDASNDPVSCSIFTDPFELLVQHVASQAALVPLLRVCRRWRDVCVPLLYAWVVVRKDWDERTLEDLLWRLEPETLNAAILPPSHGAGRPRGSAGRHVLRLSLFPNSDFLNPINICGTFPGLLSRLFSACGSSVISVHNYIPPNSRLTNNDSLRLLNPARLHSLSISVHRGEVYAHNWTHDTYCIWAELLPSNNQLNALSISGSCFHYWPKLDQTSYSTISSSTRLRTLSIVVGPPVIDWICSMPEYLQHLEQLTMEVDVRSTSELSDNEILNLVVRLTDATGTGLVSLRMNVTQALRTFMSLWLSNLVAVSPKLQEIVWFVSASENMSSARHVARAIAKRNKEGRMQPIIRIGLGGVDFLTATPRFFADVMALMSILVHAEHVEEITLLDVWKPSLRHFFWWLRKRCTGNGSGDREEDRFALLHQYYLGRQDGSITVSEDPHDEVLARWQYSDLILLLGRDLAKKLIHLSAHTGVSIVDCAGRPLSEHAIYNDARLVGDAEKTRSGPDAELMSRIEEMTIQAIKA